MKTRIARECGRVAARPPVWRGWLAAAALTAALALSGCAARRISLAPAPNAMLAQAPNAVEAKDAGITIIARTNAWNGSPRDLDTKVVPLKVTIENHSGHPLSIRYRDFKLTTSHNEKTYAALPPFGITGSGYARLAEPSIGDSAAAQFVEAAYHPPQGKHAAAPPTPAQRTVIVPQFDADDYYVAPYWWYAYPGLGFWPNAYWGAPDWTYFDGTASYMRAVKLPTRSMLRKGIPEGVVGDGGQITGFLYFEKPELSGNQSPVQFDAKLVDARTNRQFGQIHTEFVAQEK